MMPSDNPNVQREMRNSTIKNAWKKLVYTTSVFVAGSVFMYGMLVRPLENSLDLRKKENSLLYDLNTILEKQNDNYQIIVEELEKKLMIKELRKPQEPQANPKLFEEKKETPSMEIEAEQYNKLVRNTDYIVLEEKLK